MIYNTKLHFALPNLHGLKSKESLCKSDDSENRNKNSPAPKGELNDLTALFEGRKAVKTQFDRDVSYGLATFICYCNLQ